MCGIIGMVAKTEQGFFQMDVNLFSQMLVADSLRGTDGTGVFGVYKSGSISWVKVGAHPFALLKSSKYDTWATAMIRKMDIVVGHNRKATSGTTNNENSHPFLHEHIILVHNGSVSNHKQMGDTEVDSHAIAHSMVNKGYEETLASLDGAFALVWFDMKDRALRIARNSQRPLYMVDDFNSIIFASEGYMLKWIGDRNNKSWKDIKLIPEAVLLSIKQDDKQIVTKEIKLYTPAWKQNPYEHYGDGYEPWQHEDETTDSTEDEASIIAAVREDVGDEISEEDMKTISFIEQYKEQTKVYFEPKRIQPWNTKTSGCTLEGYLRGDKDVLVRVSYEGNAAFDMAKKLLSHLVLVGSVTGVMVNPASKQRILLVTNVTELSVYRTFNGTQLTGNEWVAICDKYKCNKCSNKLRIKDIATTSVNINNPENPRVFCTSCVAEHMKKLPQEERDRVLKLNEAAQKVFNNTEHDWDLRGSAHGS